MRGGNFSSSDSPNGFVGDDDSFPFVVVIDQFSDSGKLSSADFGSLVRLSFFEVLSDTEDYLKGGLVKSGMGLKRFCVSYRLRRG